jgi:hypothetical protein
MGVRQYHNKWRCYIVDTHGNKHQLYFKTEKEAQDYYDLIYSAKKPFARYKKKSNATHQELPVGLHQSFSNRMNSVGTRHKLYFIKATVNVDGKVKSFQRFFGKKRTRDKAIELCLQWRLKNQT